MKYSSDHILFLHPSSDLYGADRSLVRTVKAMSETGCRISVCLPYHGPLVDVLKELNVRVYVFRLAVMRRKYFTPWGILDFVVAMIGAYFRLVRIARSEKVTLMHSNTTAVLVGGFVARRVRVPHLWHVREIHVKPVIIRKLVARMLHRYATQIIGVSQSAIDNLLIDIPGIKDKSIIIHNGLEIEKYQLNSSGDLRSELGLGPKTILVGMIARVSYWKGQDLFLQVAEKVTTSSDNICFLALGSPFTGQDYLMDDFKENARSLMSKDRFFIHEFSSDVNKYLHAFDIFVLPSTLPDPFPTTVLEAMATKKAIVINGHGGATEMIQDGESGSIVVPPNDVNLMAKKILEFAGSQTSRMNAGHKAFEVVSTEYSVEVYSKRIKKLFTRYMNSSSTDS